MPIRYGRYGQQPALILVNRRARYHYLHTGRGGHIGPKGRIAPTARDVSKLVGYKLTPETLRSYLVGDRIPPAEIKLGVAQLLGVEPEACWTEEVLFKLYRGRRGPGGRAAVH